MEFEGNRDRRIYLGREIKLAQVIENEANFVLHGLRRLHYLVIRLCGYQECVNVCSIRNGWLEFKTQWIKLLTFTEGNRILSFRGNVAKRKNPSPVFSSIWRPDQFLT